MSVVQKTATSTQCDQGKLVKKPGTLCSVSASFAGKGSLSFFAGVGRDCPVSWTWFRNVLLMQPKLLLQRDGFKEKVLPLPLHLGTAQAPLVASRTPEQFMARPICSCWEPSEKLQWLLLRLFQCEQRTLAWAFD